ncbi:MAG: phosphopantetheine-binding protein, partial [Planctomycetota bacterium]
LPPPDALRNFHLPTTSADAALQTLQAALPKSWNHTWLPSGIHRVELHKPLGSDGPIRATAILRPNEGTRSGAELSHDAPETLTADVQICDSGGALAARFVGVQLTRLANTRKPAAARDAAAAAAPPDTLQQSPADGLSLATLAAAQPDERRGLLLAHVQRRLAVVMDMAVEELAPTQPLDTLGLDSLMAFELRDDLEKSLGVSVAMDVFLQRMTLEGLADVLCSQVAEQAGPGAGDAAGADGVSRGGQGAWIEGAL